MSTIPPNWLGSIIQTQGAKARAAGDKEKENAAEAERTGADTFADKLQAVIGSGDRDTQVYSDAEGTGSQGRPFEPPAEEPKAPDQDEDDGPDRLDLQA
jgi:hypothetical protein